MRGVEGNGISGPVKLELWISEFDIVVVGTLGEGPFWMRVTDDGQKDTMTL